MVNGTRPSVDPRSEFEEILTLRSRDWTDDERAEARRIVERIPAAYNDTIQGQPADFLSIARASRGIASTRRHTCTDVVVEWVRTTSEHLCAMLEGRRVL